MASVAKVISGNTTTFTVTDSTGAAMTAVVTTGAVTGNVTQFGGSAVHNDALQMLFNLLNQLQTGLVPGGGAQELLP